MDLSLLRDNLPASSSLAQADRELLTNFKAAALSITTLYKSSLNTSKRAYNAGYAACLADVLGFIQAGLSAAETHHAYPDNAAGGVGALGLMNIEVDGRGMNIGRVMDYLEGRLEAVRAEEEEEEEDRSRGVNATRQATASSSAVPPATTTSTRAQSHSNINTAPPPAPPAKPPSSDQEEQPVRQQQPTRTSASASLPRASTSNSIPQPQLPPSPTQATLTRTRSKSRQQLGKSKDNHDSFAFTFAPPPGPHNTTPTRIPSPTATGPVEHTTSDDPNVAFPLVLPPDMNLNVAIGTKRRHAQAMAMANLLPTGMSDLNNDPNAGPSARPSGSSRRRPRGNSSMTRNTALQVVQSQEDTMDVEEEPARKRVARR